MASKHTPGPWLVPHFARPDIQCNCGYVLSPNYMGAIATVHFEGEKPGEYDDNPPLDEAIANARLIAATPDMLAALVLAESYADVMGVMTVQAIRDAIAKATGGNK